MVCATQSGTVYPDEKCDSDKKPETERECEMQQTCEYQWIATQWSEVTLTTNFHSSLRVYFNRISTFVLYYLFFFSVYFLKIT